MDSQSPSVTRDEDSDAPESVWSKAFENALELWLYPEMKRRLAEGTIAKDTPIRRFQVVMSVNAPVAVRINEEVKVLAFAKVNRPVQVGEALSEQDISSVRFDLTEEDPNAAHFTAIHVGGRWRASFDFRYNRARIDATLVVAEQFLRVAQHAISEGLLRPGLDNLFSAAELVARAFLLKIPDPRFLEPSVSHGFVSSRLHVVGGKHGNINAAFMSAFKKLSECRPAARYLREKTLPDVAEARALTQAVRDTLTEIRSSFDPRRP